ncbi:MAG: hypothetical protein H6832_03040 [Planctomycetes bacterium]|nr:hypothetical protein [Planctomycetota bacterium]
MRNSRFSIAATSAALCLTGALTAQTATYSPSYALGQVNSNNIWPHATSPMRYQQIHDAWTFTSTGTTLARGLAYRPSNQTSYLNRAGGTVEVMIRMGEAPSGVTSQTPAGTFDGNFETASVKTVFSRKKISYPSSGTTPEELKIFDIDFPFDSATFVLMNGSSTKSMSVETRCYAYSGGYAFDFVSSSAVQGYGWSLQNGSYAGCKNNAGQVVEHEVPTNQLFVGSTNATFLGKSFLPTIPGILSIGATKINATIPGTSCNLVNDPLLIIPGATNAAGDFNVSFPIPNDAKLHRVTFLSQMIFIDVAANAAGIVTSRGLENGIGGGAGVSNLGLIRMKTSAADPDSVTAITNTYNNGLVMMFRS